MKKIVGILAGAALLATSVFAADVSAKVQLDGDLFNLATGDETVAKGIMLKEYDPSGDSDYLWKLSVSGDNYGAEIWSWNIDGSVSSKKIWIKPVDAVKVTFGNIYGSSIANPNFGWWAKTVEQSSYGYQGDFTFGALNIVAAIAPGAGNYWFDSSAADAVSKVGGFWFDAKYDLGDIGKIQLIAAKEVTVGAHGFSSWLATDFAFGLAYAKMPWEQTGFYGDVILSMNREGGWGRAGDVKFQGVDSQIGGQLAIDNIMLRLTNLIQYRDFNNYLGGDDKFAYGFEFKAQYKLDSVTPFLTISGYNIMKKSMEIDLGLDTSVGGCSINAYVAVPVAFENYSFGLSVPVEFTVTF